MVHRTGFPTSFNEWWFDGTLHAPPDSPTQTICSWPRGNWVNVNLQSLRAVRLPCLPGTILPVLSFKNISIQIWSPPRRQQWPPHLDWHTFLNTEDHPLPLKVTTTAHAASTLSPALKCSISIIYNNKRWEALTSFETRGKLRNSNKQKFLKQNKTMWAQFALLFAKHDEGWASAQVLSAVAPSVPGTRVTHTHTHTPQAEQRGASHFPRKYPKCKLIFKWARYGQKKKKKTTA